jgi:hypothetical protein
MPGPGQQAVTWWQPRGVLSWQWQLKGKVDTSVRADVYDVDAVESTPADVAALHKAGRNAICYVNAGAYEGRAGQRRRVRTGLGVGLKDNVEQASSLAPWFDFAVSEECAKFHECEQLRVFTAAGKPVFHVEYDLALNVFCPTTAKLGFLVHAQETRPGRVAGTLHQVHRVVNSWRGLSDLD